jgi:hypothetical protein
LQIIGHFVSETPNIIANLDFVVRYILYSEINEISETNSIETHDNIATDNINPTHERIPKRPIKNDIYPINAKLRAFMDSFSNNEPKTTNRHLPFFNGILTS